MLSMFISCCYALNPVLSTTLLTFLIIASCPGAGDWGGGAVLSDHSPWRVLIKGPLAWSAPPGIAILKETHQTHERGTSRVAVFSPSQRCTFIITADWRFILSDALCEKSHRKLCTSFRFYSRKSTSWAWGNNTDAVVNSMEYAR